MEEIYRPLEEAGSALLETLSVYLEQASSLEGAARMLFVHPNTVRYRLGKIADLTGYDLTDPHDGHTVRIALALGRLSTPPHRAGRGDPGQRARDGATPQL